MPLDPNAHAFFQFLKDKRGRDFPFQYKLVHAPELIVPADLNIGGDLSLYNLPQLKTLPADLSIGGGLSLYNLPQLKTLPTGLNVGKDLYLRNIPQLTTLPAGLNIGRNLYLTNTPLKKHSKDEIRTMIEKQGGSIKGEINI